MSLNSAETLSGGIQLLGALAEAWEGSEGLGESGGELKKYKLIIDRRDYSAGNVVSCNVMSMCRARGKISSGIIS